ncbi:MAG: hypothetical protein J6P40_02755 [Oscillospiraceae bacterium]|nr:hypothetical protein [Oscillospiraceae bacterium]
MKSTNWDAIRAEYIGGGISQRKLAQKWNVSPGALMDKANREHWKQDRDDVQSNALARTKQKAAAAISDNATIVEDIKRNLLLRLKRIEEKYPMDATEVRTRVGNSTAIYRIRDLTAAYRDITEGMQMNDFRSNELLQSLIDLERGAVR